LLGDLQNSRGGFGQPSDLAPTKRAVPGQFNPPPNSLIGTQWVANDSVRKDHRLADVCDVDSATDELGRSICARDQQIAAIHAIGLNAVLRQWDVPNRVEVQATGG